MLQTVAGGIQYCSFLAGACCSSPIAAAWAGLHTWFMPLLHRPATAPCLHPVAAGLIHGSCLDNASHQPPFSIQHATVADLIHGSWFMPSHQPPSLYPTVWLASRSLLLEPSLYHGCHMRDSCAQAHRLAEPTSYSHPHPFHFQNLSIVVNGHAPRLAIRLVFKCPALNHLARPSPPPPEHQTPPESLLPLPQDLPALV